MTKFITRYKGTGLKIIGYPKNKRAADIHVIPKLAGITSVLMGVSYASALRRHSFTYEEFYKTTLFTGFGGAALTLGFAKWWYRDYFFDGAKYVGNNNFSGKDPFSKGMIFLRNLGEMLILFKY